jgi:hypothetical protein
MPTLLAAGIYNTMRYKTLASYEQEWPYPPIISVGPFPDKGQVPVRFLVWGLTPELSFE